MSCRLGEVGFGSMRKVSCAPLLAVLCLLMVLMLASCTTLERINGTLDTVRGAVSKVNETVDRIAAAAAEADQDGDGKLSWQELLAAVVAALGGAGIITAKAVGSANAKASSKRAEQWAALNDLQQRLAAIEAKKA